jgi:hypothetical protein
MHGIPQNGCRAAIPLLGTQNIAFYALASKVFGATRLFWQLLEGRNCRLQSLHSLQLAVRPRLALLDEEERGLPSYKQDGLFYEQSLSALVCNLGPPAIQLPFDSFLKSDCERFFDTASRAEWVKLAERQELQFRAFDFSYIAGAGSADQRGRISGPSWLSLVRLDACAETIPANYYEPDSGTPKGAAGGAARLLFAPRSLVNRYAARIDLSTILGPNYPGSFIACPAPEGGKLTDVHPFMQTLCSENVGLLCRLSAEPTIAYWKESYWRFHPQKPDELCFENWPDQQFPDDVQFDGFMALFERRAEFCFRQGKTVAIHCRVGVGRTGTLMAAYVVKKLILAQLDPDPWGVILELRKHRQGFVLDGPQLAGLFRYAQRQLKLGS